MTTSDRIIGIDLGGTKSAAVFATADGTVHFRTSAPTPAAGGPEAVIPALVRLAREAMEAAGGEVAGVGVSAGAPADGARGVVYPAPNLPGWPEAGLPLAEVLSAELGGLPVYLENDADATALAEWRFGAGRGARTMAFLTVGTGIGAGLILDGRLHRGAAGAGGEIGHVAVVSENGRRCACGLSGCLEAYASGPSVARIAAERGFSGEPTGQAVVAAVRAGDDAAAFALAQAGEMLGRGIATLAMLLNPECVVLGTLAVHAGDLLFPPLEAALRERAWPRLSEGLRVVPAALGDRAQDLAAVCAYLVRGQSGGTMPEAQGAAMPPRAD